MTQERWQLIKSLFDRVAECDGASRTALLAELCGDDAELRKEVESLLASDQEAVSLTGIPRLMADAVDAGGRLELPEYIGQYRVLSLLGEGGMGAVYEAEQIQPRRKVAIKVIKPGLATPHLLHRFELEAQALGRLQHPGIAQIHEAGMAATNSGQQPFFAMEFIAGRSLLEDVKARKLDTRQRLELLAKVCDAVHHAHQRGIIHRDLKPGNILVDETGQPKVLDFGVARLTDSDALVSRYTDAGQLVGTLSYMSPEQVLADPLEIDTRSDVYSLGVMLYEMLAGSLPYKAAGKLHATLLAIREEEPTLLGSFSRELRGDIETIAAKCLEKDKSRRYASASDLAADIRRYLHDEPLMARPPGAVYRVRKFARRNMAIVAGIAAVFVVLAGGVIVSSLQAMRARRAELAALQERDRASGAERSALQALERATSAEQSATQERDRAVSAERRAERDRERATSSEAQAVEERNRVVAEKQRADSEAETARAVSNFLQFDLLSQANTWNQARLLQGAATIESDDKPDPDLKVRTALDRAAQRIGGKFKTTPLLEAAIRQTIADAYSAMQLYADAQPQLEAALNLKRQALGTEHPDTLRQARSVARNLQVSGKHLQAQRLIEATLADTRRVLGSKHQYTLDAMNIQALGYQLQRKYSQAEAIYLSILEISPNQPNALHNLGDLYRAQHKYAEAERFKKKSLQLVLYHQGENSKGTLNVMWGLAHVYELWGKHDKAETMYRTILEIERRMLSADDASTLSAMGDLARAYRLQLKHREAAEEYNKILAAQRKKLGEEDPKILKTMGDLALVYQSDHKYTEAQSLNGRILEIVRHKSGADDASLHVVMGNLAENYRLLGKFGEAEELAVKVVDIRRRVLGQDHGSTLWAMNRLGVIYSNGSKYAEAEDTFNAVLKIDPEYIDALANLGEVFRKKGMFGKAEDAYNKALRNVIGQYGEDYSGTQNVILELASFYWEQRKFGEAEALYSRLLTIRNRSLGGENTKTLQSMADLEKMYQLQNRHSEAAAIFTQLLPLQQRISGENHSSTLLALSRLGVSAVMQNRFVEAERFLRDALNGHEKTKSDSVNHYWCKGVLGASLAGQKRFAEAETLMLEGYRRIVADTKSPKNGEDMPHWLEERLVQLYESWGKQEKASEWRQNLAANELASKGKQTEASETP